MKRTTFIYCKTFIIILISTLLLALILSAIQNANILTGKNYDVSVIIASLLIFFIAGSFFGYNINKNGFLHAVLFSFLYLLILFLIKFLGYEQQLQTNQLLILSGKFILLIIGAIIGRNLKG